jgi:uncharacterized protein YceK
MRALIIVLLFSVSGCATIEQRPALSKAIAFTGAALAAGYIAQHQGAQPASYGEMPLVCRSNPKACQ